MTRDDLHKAGLVYIQRSEISRKILAEQGVCISFNSRQRMEIAEEAGRIGSRLVSSWPVVRHEHPQHLPRHPALPAASGCSQSDRQHLPARKIRPARHRMGCAGQAPGWALSDHYQASDAGRDGHGGVAGMISMARNSPNDGAQIPSHIRLVYTSASVSRRESGGPPYFCAGVAAGTT